MHVVLMDGFPYLIGIVLFGDGANRANARALAAEGAVKIIERLAIGGSDGHGMASAHHFQDIYALDGLADVDASAAFDATVGVADQSGVVDIDRLRVVNGFESVDVDAELVGQRLQFAVEVFRTGGAVGIMVGENQFGDRLPGVQDPGGVGSYDHALADRRRAGSHKPFLAFDLHGADPAVGFDSKVGIVAQGGDFDIVFLGRVKDGSSLFDGDIDIVYFQINHSIYPSSHISSESNRSI